MCNIFLLYLAFDLFLDEMVLAFVVEDDVNLLCAVATDIRPCRKGTESLSLIDLKSISHLQLNQFTSS